ncbi:hypothetical protein CL616_03100 [archaeon]|nr:hypothetical protein [archaeon]
MIDLMIVDDKPSVAEIAKAHAKDAGLSAQSFLSPIQAQAYLDTLTTIPQRYLLDMHYENIEGHLNKEQALRDLYARLLDQGIDRDKILLFSGNISDNDLEVISLMGGAMAVHKLLQIPSEHPRLERLSIYCEYFRRWESKGKPADGYTLVDFIRETGLQDQTQLPVSQRKIVYKTMLQAMGKTL